MLTSKKFAHFGILLFYHCIIPSLWNTTIITLLPSFAFTVSWLIKIVFADPENRKVYWNKLDYLTKSFFAETFQRDWENRFSLPGKLKLITIRSIYVIFYYNNNNYCPICLEAYNVFKVKANGHSVAVFIFN